MNDIIIKTVKHESQKYSTLDDYFRDADGNLIILVSDLKNQDYEACIAIHALIEVLLVEKAGISKEAITRFDKRFEAQRKPGNLDEPGDDPKAPYKKPHLAAVGIESILAALLGVDQSEYYKKLNSMP